MQVAIAEDFVDFCEQFSHEIVVFLVDGVDGAVASVGLAVVVTRSQEFRASAGSPSVGVTGSVELWNNSDP